MYSLHLYVAPKRPLHKITSSNPSFRGSSRRRPRHLAAHAQTLHALGVRQLIPEAGTGHHGSARAQGFGEGVLPRVRHEEGGLRKSKGRDGEVCLLGPGEKTWREGMGEA